VVEKDGQDGRMAGWQDGYIRRLTLVVCVCAYGSGSGNGGRREVGRVGRKEAKVANFGGRSGFMSVCLSVCLKKKKKRKTEQHRISG
jgi:hypothetical protein